MILLLVACVPVMSGPSPAPLSRGQQGEFGFAVTGGVAATPLTQTTQTDQAPVFGAGLYLRLERPDGWGFIVRTDFGLPYGLSGGVGLRYGFVRTHGAYFGVQADLGFLYGGVSIPGAFRVHERVWLWTQPGITAGVLSQAVFPIGTTVEVGDHLALHAQAQMLTPVFEARFNRRQPTGVTGALSLSSRF